MKKQALSASLSRTMNRQMKKSLNRNLKPILKAVRQCQSSLRQSALLIRDMQETREKRACRELASAYYKQLKVMLVSASHSEGSFGNEALLEEQLRHLVRDVQRVAFEPLLLDTLEKNRFDLILALGNGGISSATAAALRSTAVPKAIWLQDEMGVPEETHMLAPLFDCLFTQNRAHIPVYRARGSTNCRYLPPAADTERYFPRSSAERFHSDLLLIGDAHANEWLSKLADSEAGSNKKISVYGSGWENRKDHVTMVREEELADWCNGAAIVVNGSFSLQRVLDVYACGAFQLVQEHSRVLPYLESRHDALSFQTEERLRQLLDYYETRPEERRLEATQALADLKYNESYLQRALRLLDSVCLA